jgi:hypothetical protein
MDEYVDGGFHDLNRFCYGSASRNLPSIYHYRWRRGARSQSGRRPRTARVVGCLPPGIPAGTTKNRSFRSGFDMPY